MVSGGYRDHNYNYLPDTRKTKRKITDAIKLNTAIIHLNVPLIKNLGIVFKMFVIAFNKDDDPGFEFMLRIG
jgi:hypothetical protein